MPVPATAAPPVAVLVWDGGTVSPACDRSAELARNVAAYLGRDAFEPNAPLSIRIGLRRSPDDRALIADISKVGEDGKVIGVRSVSAGGSCETLDDPLTLVVALMLDAPPEEPAPVAPVPTPEPLTAPEPTEHDPLERDPDPEETNTEPGFALISAGVGSSIGLLPFPNYGPRLQIELKPRRFWGISLSGLALFGSHTDLPGSGSIDFRSILAGAALCPLDTLRDRYWLAACGGVEVAWIEAEGSGLSPHRRKTDWTLSPSLQLQAARQVAGPLLLGGLLGVSFPISRNRYVYRDIGGSSHLAFEVASPALVLGVFAAFKLH
ncbi:MAG TPA: hypothetical protein VHM25_11105 [Polyangiaceae bacterium]|nr:hypothetical protein [Polyangiaceae bacterium]